MSYFDDNEDYLIYGDREKPDDYAPHEKTCTHCGASGLYWQDFGSGWKLYDENDKRHVCPSQKPSADDFDAL